jgi:RNA polymerase sigma-70 factor, ECF subfamily
MEGVRRERMRVESERAAPAVSFDDFSQIHREQLFRLALRILGAADPAQDVVQDVLLQALRHWRRIEDPLPWCRRALVRRALSELGRRRRFGPMPNRACTDEDLLERLTVERALAKLKPQARALLALALGEGWSYAEIAVALKIPEGTVGSRLHKAKADFRRVYEDMR